MNEWMETKEGLLERLGTNASDGLTSRQAEKNRQRYGANRLTRSKPESMAQRIRDAIKEPMIVMLIMAWLIALGVNIFQRFTGGEADFLECVGIFIAILLSVIISVVMEGRSAKAFEALSQISDNIIVRALRDNHTVLLKQEDIVTGDILLLSTGNKVPADGRLLEATDLSADESALTGESVPVGKNAELNITDEKTPLAERANMLYAGTYITGGYCKMVVTATGDATEFGKIARELGVAQQTVTPLQEKLARLGKNITGFGIIASIIIFTVQMATFAWNGNLTLDSIMEAFVTSIVLIVAVVPEGLPTIVAISLSINIIKLSRQNALVKKLVASETIGCINVICSDKTGTLTENRMTVAGFYDTAWHTDFSELTSPWLIHNICLNTTADIGEDGAFLGNPTECAMLNLYEKSTERTQSGRSYRDERKSHTTLRAFPFSSELQHMTTISSVDGKIISWIKGSPECLFSMCRISEPEKATIEKHIRTAQEKAMRVIAFAHKELPAMQDYGKESLHREMESDMTFDGFVAITDPLRADVYDAVQSCRGAGIALKILTGDNIVTATAIARELHLLDNGCIALEAKDIADMSDRELQAKLPSIAVIARSTPIIKMRVVRLLKEAGNVVAATGDGINDAPSLKNADVSIAMGISGTEVSKEASDIVLLDDSFATITRAVEWGRNIYENFKRFITFQLTVNLASVIVVLSSVLIGLKAPFTALDLLWINIIMDGPPALTLGLEPGHDDLMSRKPVSRNENIITPTMLGRIVGSALYMSAIFLAQYLLNFLNAAETEMSTVLFTLFVLFQLFNAFNCRELRQASLLKNLFKNRPMLLATACTFILQVLIIQYAGTFFGTVPLNLSMWVKLIGTASTVILFAELAKLIWRKTHRQAPPAPCQRRLS